MQVIFWVLVGLFVCAAASSEKKVVCYFGSWAVYRPGNGRIEISDIDPTLCTHLIYTFVGLKKNGEIRILDPWADLPSGKDGYNKFNNLRHINPKAKTLIAIGGWNEGSTNYSIVAANPKLRKTFANNAVEFVKKYNFDGLDFDWEYPNQRKGSKPADKKNYILLLKALRLAFRRAGLLLSAAVAAAPFSAEKSYIINNMVKHLDFINLMTYDFHGSWETKTGLNSPLRAGSWEKGNDKYLNVNASVLYWLSQLAPAEKIVLGIPLYGRSFTLDDPNQKGVGAPARLPGMAGPYTRQAGTLGYNEICENFKTEKWEEYYEKEQRAPYAVRGNQWVGYDNSKSIGEKVDLVNNLRLGGAMVWSIETDDFRGVCGEKYPLLKTLNRALTEGPTTTTTQPTTPSTTTTTSTPTTTSTSTPTTPRTTTEAPTTTASTPTTTSTSTPTTPRTTTEAPTTTTNTPTTTSTSTPTTPRTTTEAPTTTASTPTTTSTSTPTTPRTTTEAPTTTTNTPTTTSTSTPTTPRTTTEAPTTTTNTPTTTSTSTPTTPRTTTEAPTTTTNTPTTTSTSTPTTPRTTTEAPTTTTNTPTTTSTSTPTTPRTTTEAPTTTTNTPTTTSTSTPTTPRTTTEAPTTTTNTPTTTSTSTPTSPRTTTEAPTTTASTPTTTSTSTPTTPRTTTEAPTTTTNTPTTTSTSTPTSPRTTTEAPTTTASTPTTTSTSTPTTPRTTTEAPTTTTNTPTTTSTSTPTSPRTTTEAPTTTASTPTTTSTSTPTTPRTTTEAPTTTTNTPTTTSTSTPTTPRTTTEAPTTTTEPTSTTEDPCDMVCREVGILRDPSDCGVYYVCLANPKGYFDKTWHKCPSNLFFDLNLKLCNWPNLVDCTACK